MSKQLFLPPHHSIKLLVPSAALLTAVFDAKRRKLPVFTMNSAFPTKSGREVVLSSDFDSGNCCRAEQVCVCVSVVCYVCVE